jgi:hypothetical protein
MQKNDRPISVHISQVHTLLGFHLLATGGVMPWNHTEGHVWSSHSCVSCCGLLRRGEGTSPTRPG